MDRIGIYVTNATAVLAKVGEKGKVLVEDIKYRKMKYIAYIIRENGIFMLAVQGRIQRKPISERKKTIRTGNDQLASQFPL